MSTPTDYTKPPGEIILDLIKEANPTNELAQNLTGTEYTLGAPSVVVIGDETDPAYMNRKTKVVALAVPGSGFGASRDLFYNRLHWRDVIPTTDPLSTEFGVATDPFIIDAETTLAELTAQINSRYELNLTVDDYFDVNLPDISSGPALVKLEAQGNSKIYIGGVMLQIQDGGMPLMVAIPTNVLSGLIYVQPDNVVVQLQSLLTQMEDPSYW